MKRFFASDADVRHDDGRIVCRNELAYRFVNEAQTKIKVCRDGPGRDERLSCTVTSAATRGVGIVTRKDCRAEPWRRTRPPPRRLRVGKRGRTLVFAVEAFRAVSVCLQAMHPRAFVARVASDARQACLSRAVSRM